MEMERVMQGFLRGGANSVKGYVDVVQGGCGEWANGRMVLDVGRGAWRQEDLRASTFLRGIIALQQVTSRRKVNEIITAEISR